MERLLNLSNIANILPYYGIRKQNEVLVKQVNPKLLPQFECVLGGIFSYAEFDSHVRTTHPALYQNILDCYKGCLFIDMSSNEDLVFNEKLEVFGVKTGRMYMSIKYQFPYAEIFEIRIVIDFARLYYTQVITNKHITIRSNKDKHTHN